MTPLTRLKVLLLTALVPLVAVACKSDTTTPSTVGLIQVSVTTTGDDLDPDGYTVAVDGGTGQSVGLDGSVTFDEITEGARQVTLSGLAANCSVVGGNPKTVTVVAEQTATVDFVVNCAAITGTVEVITVTTGVDLDPDGYMVEVEGKAAVSIGVIDTIQVTDVLALDRTVELTDIASNCTVQAGASLRTVTVPENGTVSTTFVVNCVALEGSIQVTAVTTGDNQDDQYLVTVDGAGPGTALAANGSVTIPNVATGDRLLQLTDVAGNCSVTPADTATVNVPSDGTASHTFNVSCAALVGSVQITTVTSGSQDDPDGYSVTVQGESPVSIGTDETVTVTNVGIGTKTVQLTGLASNCSVTSSSPTDSNPETVTVTDGATATVTFNVACPATLSDKIVFDTDRDGNFQIYVMNPDGTGLSNISNNAFNDREPFVSYDGQKIVFVSDQNGNKDIWVMDVDGGNRTRLTEDNGDDTEPAWSPDGSKIVFSANRNGLGSGVWIMDSDGNNEVSVTDVVGRDGLAQFSPDGTTIVFTSERTTAGGGTAGDADIWTMNTSGGNLTQLTFDAANDFAPAWSPDGSQIAFTSERDAGNREIYTMNANGTNQLNRSNDPTYPDLAPQWSPDGSFLVFAKDFPGGDSEIFTMTSTGGSPTNRTNSPTSKDFEASWSP